MREAKNVDSSRTPNGVDQFQAQLQADGRVVEIVRGSNEWYLQPDRDGQAGLRFVVRPVKNGVYLGAQINKGLDRSALGYSPSTKLVMQKHWAWATSIDELLPRIQEWSGVEVYLQFTNGMEPGFVPDTSAYRHHFSWQILDGRLHLLRPVYDASLAGEIAAAPSLRAAIDHLCALPEYRWLWARLEWGQSVREPAVESTIREMMTRFGVWYADARTLTRGGTHHG